MFHQVRDQIHKAGYYVDADTTDRKIQKKVHCSLFRIVSYACWKSWIS